MGKALSPRNPAPKLRSTVVEEYGTPRRESSVFQSVSLKRGYTVRAGAIRRSRLQKGVSVDNAGKESEA